MNLALNSSQRLICHKTQTNSEMTFSNRLLFMDIAVFNEQQRLTYIWFVWTLHAI